MRVGANAVISVIPDLIRDTGFQALSHVALDPDFRQDDVEGFAL
jgi:hypothetical protein